jgi:RNA polymerase-binding transcription factor DksA
MSLTAEQIEELRNTMRQRRELLRDEVLSQLEQGDGGPMAELHGQVHDSGEESIADLLADLSISGLENANAEIIAIENALMRIKRGTYGYCVDCEDELLIERLQANPSAERCVPCQEKFEDNRSEQDATPSL